MPISKPASPRKKSGKSQPKTVTGRGSGRTSAASNKPVARAGIKPASRISSQRSSGTPLPRGSRATPPPRPPSPSFWERLSPERRLDVIGMVLGLTGFVIILGLLSTNRGLLLGGVILFLFQLFGWGLYVLAGGLMLFGLWLVLRKIERIPPLSFERAAGSLLLFLWLLTLLHATQATAADAESVALTGRGGGYIGSLFVRLLWSGLGVYGAYVALLAWLMIGLAITLDVSVQDLFRWIGPLTQKLRDQLFKENLLRRGKTAPDTSPAADGYTPLAPAPGAHLPAAPANPLPTVLAPQSGPVPVIHWTLPQVRDILDAGNAPAINEDFIQQRARLIEETLASFSAPAQVVEINRGPTITQFGVEPLFVESRSGRLRVRVNKIASLADDLALALAAPRIRIQAPVPGHSYVGIEVPNDEMALVSLRDVVESETFQRNRKPLSFALGKDVSGHPITANLESMPHLLIAGTTGSGKSVCVNAIFTCFLLNNTPDDLKVVLVDPKRVELTNYNGIPHLLGPVVVEMDRVIGALQWMTREMDKRYHEFARIGARNITDFNARAALQGTRKMHHLVIIIDELADLMMIAPDETERTITRLAQLARATGIHMILATQRPSVDVVTGLIKANFPARIAFAVASNTDSRVILDQPGAERLLGRGDMLYQSPDAPAPVRLQGVFVSDHEIQKLVDFWRDQAGSASPYAVAGGGIPSASLPDGVPLKQQPLWEGMEESEGDPLLPDAIDLVRREGRASVSMLQRRLRIGYTRSARLVDQMEDKGIVGPPEGATQVRQVLDYGPTAPPKDDGA